MIKKGQKDYLCILIYFGLIGTSWLLFNNWISIQTVAVILTGAAIVWYTIETKVLRIETQKLTEIQIRPFVILEIKDGNFVLRNIGHGPALNVSIRPVQISADESIIVCFEEMIPSIEPSKSVAITGESFHKGKSAGDFFLAHIDPEYANRNLSVFINYQNIELRHYTTKEQISPKRREIVDFQS